MSIKKWPAHERPRERLVECGVDPLSDAELLAIIFGRGTHGEDAISLSRRLLQDYGGLRGIVGLDFQAFSAVRGLGLAKFALLHAGMEIGRRLLRDEMHRGPSISDTTAAKAFLSAHLGHRPRETFGAIFLDTRHRVLKFESLSEGTVDSATVHPREVVRRVLAVNAAAVIFAHNHPSGHPDPSDADRRLTRRLADALKLIDVRVLDHFIVAHGEITSLADLGMLDGC